MRKTTFSILAVVFSTACGPQAIEESGPEGVRPDDTRLEALAYQLKNSTLEEAMANPQYRPLCDRQGYPLVGNVVSKVDLTDVSEFCAEVRRTSK